METGEVEFVVALVDGNGAYYEIEDDPAFGAAWGSIYPVSSNDNLAILLFSESYSGAEFECYVDYLILSSASFPEGVKAQVASPLDLVYRDGKLAGILLSFISSGVSLLDFLEKGSVDSVLRTRVACNICALVLLMGRVGLSVGRVDPNRIIVDESSCRVFFIPSSFDAFAGLNGAPPFLEEDVIGDEPIDIAFHIYALLHGRQCSELERRLWSDTTIPGSEPTSASIARELLNSLHKPLFVRLLDSLFHFEALEGPFWAEAPALRPLYERAFCHNASGQTAQLAIDFYEALEKPKRFSGSRLAGSVEKIKRFIFGGFEREEIKKKERRISGSKSITQPLVFWLTTLGCSASMGLYAMFNGFSPLELLLPSLPSHLPEAPSEIMWQFVVASIAGSAVFNIALAERNHFVGYGKGSYLFSMAMGVLFMFVVRLTLEGAA